MNNHPPTIDRRHFLALAAAAAATAQARGARGAASSPSIQPAPTGDSHRGPCVIASGNGMETVELAFDLLTKGTRPVEACVRGVALVEDNPNDMSVGLGGLPNEEGIIELDSACMDGPLHKAGSVGALQNIKNPAAVALEVLRRTDHVMLVGEGALKFARRMGFKEQDLHTEKSRAAWARWRANLNPNDKWLDTDQIINFNEPAWQSSDAQGGGLSSPRFYSLPLATPEKGPRGRAGERVPSSSSLPRAPWGRAGEGVPSSSLPPHITRDSHGVLHTTGTIHCSATNANQDVGCCTTTSGLAWKLPGRVGDSPIIGAGLYCDNAVGSAGATGRGESVIQTVGSAWIISAMEGGMTPTEACLAACKRIVDRTREPRFFDDNNRPRFSVTYYAVRKDGAYGSASILKGGQAAVCAGGKAVRLQSEFLYE